MEVDVTVRCFKCLNENKHCIAIIKEAEEFNLWHWRRGRYPHGWIIQESETMDFYDKKGNYCDAGNGQAIVLGICPNCK